MRSLLTVVAVLLVLNQGFAAISDNLCDTPCEFCCRNHVCQTQEYCTSGNTNYYGIIGTHSLQKLMFNSKQFQVVWLEELWVSFFCV